MIKGRLDIQGKNSGQSYKHFMLVNYDSRVGIWGYFPVRYDSRVVIYEHKMFIRLATGEVTDQDKLAPDYSSIQLRLFRQRSSRFKPYLSPVANLIKALQL